MSPLILPFDQASFYNLAAEVMTGEILSWVHGRRRASPSYNELVMERASEALEVHGIAVDREALMNTLIGDEFWRLSAENDSVGIQALLLPIISGNDSIFDQGTTLAMLFGEVILALTLELPTEQRHHMTQVTQLKGALVQISNHVDRIHDDLQAGFDRVSQLLVSRNAEATSNSSFPVVTRSTPSTEAIAASMLCASQLISLQQPWGEWSDRRTELESLIAERRHREGTVTPKPNVARTLFALEALENFSSDELANARKRALGWMLSNLSQGWFWEWTQGQTEHSETPFTEALRRADVRHTAQVLTALCRWQDRRDHIAAMVNNLVSSQLSDGFWPNNARGSTPRLLATVYAVEALASIVSGVFRLPINDLMDRSEERAARKSLALGVNALLQVSDQNGGLLKTGDGLGASPYLTGLALFRIARLSRRTADLEELSQSLIDGLLGAAQVFGWEDSSVPPIRRTETQRRTTLRCVAGLAQGSLVGLRVPRQLLDHAIRLSEHYVLNTESAKLDSPDYACTLIALCALYDLQLFPLPGEIVTEIATNKSRYKALWTEEVNDLLQACQPLAALNVPGYAHLAAEYSDRLHMLDSS